MLDASDEEIRAERVAVGDSRLSDGSSSPGSCRVRIEDGMRAVQRHCLTDAEPASATPSLVIREYGDHPCVVPNCPCLATHPNCPCYMFQTRHGVGERNLINAGAPLSAASIL